jgi:DNA-binding transcriptional ArsR family regulator
MDRVFDALANAHRRGIVFALGLRPHTVSELAQMRGLTLSAIHRHIRILEDSGLARRRKVGRTNVLTLDRRALLALQDWLEQFHAYWGTDAESLDNYRPHLERSADP